MKWFSIDPGGTCLGWAHWDDAVLVACGLSRSKASTWAYRAKDHREFLAARGAYPGLVVSECMRVRAFRGRGNPQQLVELNGIVGFLGNEFVEPSQWKGMVDRNVEQARTRRALAPEELALLEAVKPPSLAHNAWSAVGIGLWWLGRAHKARKAA